MENKTEPVVLQDQQLTTRPLPTPPTREPGDVKATDMKAKLTLLRRENAKLREELLAAKDANEQNFAYIKAQEEELKDLQGRFLDLKQHENDVIELMRSVFASQEVFIEISRKALMQVINKRPAPTPKKED